VDRTELGAVLRAWRARLQPADVGLPAGSRRRTPGLRREEVAQLAGVSADYVTRLEQARGSHPSEAVLAALAQALRLSDVERDHLFDLAGARAPMPDRICESVRPSVRRLMERFADLPALLVDAKMDVLAWNPMATALLGDLSSMPPARRNIARQSFLSPPGRVQAGPGALARMQLAVVADLRAATGRYPTDPGLRELIAELRRGSPTFERLWQQRPVGVRHSDRKRIAHPELGVLELDCVVLHVFGDDQWLIVYSAAPGTPEADALARLRLSAVAAPGPRGNGMAELVPSSN
jgi:transcriptional regulator with XRE-family HTH domain